MPHTYVSVTMLKGTGALNIDGTAFDTRLRQVGEAIADELDRFTARTFQPQVRVKTFPGDDSTLLLVDDLIKVTSLKEDTNKDGTFETTWDATDYILRPLNSTPTKDYGRPYTSIMVNPNSNGSQDIFLPGPQMYEIDGTWGYNAVTRATSVKTSGSLGYTATTVTVNTSGVEPGMTVLIDSEQLYIESTASGGTSLTVERAVNGSTAGTHATTATIDRYVYSGPLVEASLIQAARLWKRKDSGFASQVGYPDTGVVVTFRGGLDSDVKQLIMPYKRLR